MFRLAMQVIGVQTFETFPSQQNAVNRSRWYRILLLGIEYAVIANHIPQFQIGDWLPTRAALWQVHELVRLPLGVKV